MRNFFTLRVLSLLFVQFIYTDTSPSFHRKMSSKCKYLLTDNTVELYKELSDIKFIFHFHMFPVLLNLPKSG